MKYKKRNKLLWAWIKRMVWDRHHDYYEDLRYPNEYYVQWLLQKMQQLREVEMDGDRK